MSVVALCELPSKSGSNSPFVLEGELPLYGGCTPADIGINTVNIDTILGAACLGEIDVTSHYEECGRLYTTTLKPDGKSQEFSRPTAVVDINTYPFLIKMNELAHRGNNNVDASVKAIDSVLRRALVKAAGQRLLVEPLKNNGGAIGSLVGVEAVTGAVAGPFEMIGMWALLQSAAAGVSLKNHKTNTGHWGLKAFRPGLFPLGFQPERFAAVVASLKIEPEPLASKVANTTSKQLPSRFRTMI